MYDDSNIFAKILKKEIPASIIYEDDLVLCFKDINPKAKVHVLVIPKVFCISFDDFAKNQSVGIVGEFFKKVEFIAKDVLKLEHFRLQMNNGASSGQEVFHFHVHILSN